MWALASQLPPEAMLWRIYKPQVKGASMDELNAFLGNAEPM